MRRTILLGLIACFLSMGSGCALLSSLLGSQRPSLTFREVRFTGWSLDSVRLDLVYELDNPYDVPLRLAQVAYQLEVEGRRIVSGAPKEGLSIRPRRKQTLSFPATIHFLDVIPAVTALFSKQSLGYRASGRLGVDTPLGIVSMPLSKSGDISVPKLPKVEITGIQAPRITAQGATLSLGLSVENRNAFPLPLDSIDWAFQVDKHRVATGSTVASAVGGSQTRQVQIPIQLGAGAMAGAARSLLSGGQADVGLQGSLRLGKVDAPLRVNELLRLAR